MKDAIREALIRRKLQLRADGEETEACLKIALEKAQEWRQEADRLLRRQQEDRDSLKDIEEALWDAEVAKSCDCILEASDRAQAKIDEGQSHDEKMLKLRRLTVGDTINDCDFPYRTADAVLRAPIGFDYAIREFTRDGFVWRRTK